MGAKAGETALALLDAGTATGGRMRAVLDPELAGVPVVGVGAADWLARLHAAGCATALARPLVAGALSAALAASLSLAPAAIRGGR